MNFTSTKIRLNQITTPFLIVLLLTLLSFQTVQAQDTSTTDQGVFQFENEVLDYGDIAYGSNGVRSFNFKNVGTAPIVISKVKASCGCTVPKKPEGAIMPGETASIEVQYDTKRAGAFSKTITVTSNANKEKIMLKIKGEIQPKNDMAVHSKS